ncbi:MAG: hypothetical protein AAGM67_18315 [Bacteroidota bacterium]
MIKFGPGITDEQKILFLEKAIEGLDQLEARVDARKIRTQSISFVSIWTDTLVSNAELALERLPKLRERLVGDLEMFSALDEVENVVRDAMPLGDTTYEYKQVIEALEGSDDNGVVVIGGILRWSARHSGLDIEA